MSNRPIVTAVASYRTRSAAHADFRALSATSEVSEGAFATALLEKGANGELAVDALESSPNGPVWSGVLIASVLTVLAPPVGLAMLARLVEGVAVLAGAGSLAGHFWNNIAQQDLRQMSELLESGQASVVVVASDRDQCDVERLLAEAATTLAAKTDGDLDRDFAASVAETAASLTEAGAGPAHTEGLWRTRPP